jgi:hypothetical protein
MPTGLFRQPSLARQRAEAQFAALGSVVPLPPSRRLVTSLPVNAAIHLDPDGLKEREGQVRRGLVGFDAKRSTNGHH